MRSPVVPVVVLALIAVPLFGQSNDVAVWIGSSRVGTTSTGGSDIHFDRGNAFGVSLKRARSAGSTNSASATSDPCIKAPPVGRQR